MILRLGAGVVLVLLCGCQDEGPTGPSPTPTPTASGVGSTTSDVVSVSAGPLVGTVVNAVTGAPVPGASVAIASGPTVSTGSDGGFEADLSGVSTSFHVVTEAPGFFPRETNVRPVVAGTGPVPVTLELLPEGDDFDLGFFDHIFREVGAAGTHPWMSEPQFEIWERVFRCTGFVAESPCEELTALETRAPKGFEAMARAVIQDDARRYTDLHVTGSRITTRLHEPGVVLSRAAFVERGKIIFALVARDDNFSWAFWRYAGDDAMVGGHVHLNRKHLELRGVYSHELAHTLGYAHPLGLDQVPRDSIMRRGHGDGPSRLDVLHGRILYHRPPGSRTPDVDPPGYLLNGLRDGSQASRGGDTIASAP